MKNLLLQSLRIALGIAVVVATCAGVTHHRQLPSLPERVVLGALALLALAAVCVVLFWRVRSEDRSARVEAALCRERNAGTCTDQALAESDLLLERLTRGRDSRPPLAQLMAIQAELQQVRRQYAPANPSLASRIDLLCTRVDRVAQALSAVHAVEPG
jgi:hypothetical protein